jgi:hypothetical protein
LELADKPRRLFGRESEWAELTSFADSQRPGASLGLVYGRRRQGKTLMLELLARRSRGFIFGAVQQSQAQTLLDLGTAYADFLGLPAPVAFGGWREALDALLTLGEEQPVPVILDEFPYLVTATPALPSYLQHALSPLSRAKELSRTRLILCGSALSTMSQLLAGGAPLRGRAILELVVRPFGFREAASFWGLLDQPDLAFLVHSLVGGTPAYREMCDDVPGRAGDFGSWAARRLLNPASAMFREGGQLLREEAPVADPTSYAAVLSAISAGCHRRSEIAAVVGRPATALAGPLSGLYEAGLISRTDDALRDRRSVFTVADPIVRFHQLVISRHEPELVAGRATRVWESVADTVAARIFGPHFEYLAREWCFEHASAAALGGIASWVRPTEIACRDHRQTHEVDVVVTEIVSFGNDRIAAIGEAKGTGDAVGVGQLERLEHVRGLLPSAKVTTLPKILLFGRSGFTRELAEVASRRADVELVDLDRLYHGD